MSGGSGGSVSRPTPIRSSRILAEISPRGSVPFDMQSLPLVSPDGRFIATQTQVPPTWPTVLAEHNAQIPIATRIEIYEVLDESVEFARALQIPVVLGRSYNSEGFLVEAPQPNGARWIGLAAWTTGEITWLVDGDNVNAFAVLGEDGRLAWCRRPVDWPENSFELVVRRESDEWSLQSPYESWLMPTWSGRGDNLFVLSLSEGELTASYGTATNEIAWRQSRRSIHLASYSNVYTAYQTMGAQISSPGLPVTTEQFVFHHPARARMAIWRPRANVASSMTFFDFNTFAAVLESDTHALVTTEKSLVLQNAQDMRDRRELIAGVQIPRVTNSDHWRYILLSPQHDAIAITAMRQLR